MQVLVTAGPTREQLDPVRFITNASSGRMGCAVAAAAVRGGHNVVLLAGPGSGAPAGCNVVPFVTVADLKVGLEEHFVACDVLVMAAAVGDFRPASSYAAKLRRSDGPVVVRLVPTDDVVAALAVRKRKDQVVVVFAVEEGSPEQVQAQARAKMTVKNADYVVVNRPEAIGAEQSDACVLSAKSIVLPWARRTKDALAEEIVKLISVGAR